MVLDEYYRNVAARYDELRLDRTEEIALTIARIGGRLRPGAPVLEIGAGTGRYAQRLHETGAWVVALDQHLAMLQHAPQALPRVCGHGQALPYVSGAFAACLLILVIHQVPADQRGRMLAEVRRVLRPGGSLLIKTSSHVDLQRRTSARYFPAGLAINQSRYPRIEDLITMAGQAGLTLAAREAVHSYEHRPVPELLNAVRAKHNTMLALLPDADFQAGYARLERELRGARTFRVDHYHTLLTFTG